jgi:murein L,D-transpeptidase YcbB/YkuD
VKNLTTSEGGALAFRLPEPFDHSELYKFFNTMSLHGQSKDALAKTQPGAWRYDVEFPGWKCNMTDLQAAIDSGNQIQLDKVATDSFLLLATHMRDGRTPNVARKQWFMTDGDAESTPLITLLTSALVSGTVPEALVGLDPVHKNFAILKASLKSAKTTVDANAIRVNMERWRWMPENLGSYHFLVNLAGYELQEVRAGQVEDRMNVVVGAVATQTPEFSDEMEYVEINPTWTVPYTIATTEMLPKLRANPFAYATDFDVFMNGKLISWGGINWAAYGPGSFPFTFRQHPGPKNALGKVKFMLPNRHNIYLHDTPAKDKFLQTTRAFSHGCIRLSRPMDLLTTVVGGDAGWPQSKIDAVLAAGKTVQVPLPFKIPVHLIYATAFMGANGVEFRPDVYGRDRKLYAALFGKPSS